MDGFMGFSQQQVLIFIVLLIIVSALVYRMYAQAPSTTPEDGPVPDTDAKHEEED